MLRNRLTAIGMFFILLFGIVSPLFAKDEDFGIWNVYDVEKKFHQNWKIKAGEELRYREGTGLHYYDTHVGASYQPFKFFEFGADYLQVREKRRFQNKEKWYWEERPRIYGILKATVYGYLAEYRNMLEFRIKQSTTHAIEDRNMVSLTAPYQWTPIKIQPYTTNEFFFDWRGTQGGFVQDRLIFGFKFRIYKKLGASVYYMRQFVKQKPEKWINYNILGITFRVSL